MDFSMNRLKWQRLHTTILVRFSLFTFRKVMVWRRRLRRQTRRYNFSIAGHLIANASFVYRARFYMNIYACECVARIRGWHSTHEWYTDDAENGRFRCGTRAKILLMACERVEFSFFPYIFSAASALRACSLTFNKIRVQCKSSHLNMVRRW